MDETTYVGIFIDELHRIQRGIRGMMTWYVFQDKRPGSAHDRFMADAQEFNDYRKMFQV